MTKKYIHEESSSIICLCGKCIVSILHSLRHHSFDAIVFCMNSHMFSSSLAQLISAD